MSELHDIERRVAVLEQIAADTRDALREIRADIRGLGTDIGALRGEMRSEISGLRGEISGLRGEMQTEYAGLRGEMRDLRAEMWRNFRWLRGIMLGGFAGLLAVMAHGFHWI